MFAFLVWREIIFGGNDWGKSSEKLCGRRQAANFLQNNTSLSLKSYHGSIMDKSPGISVRARKSTACSFPRFWSTFSSGVQICHTIFRAPRDSHATIRYISANISNRRLKVGWRPFSRFQNKKSTKSGTNFVIHHAIPTIEEMKETPQFKKKFPSQSLSTYKLQIHRKPIPCRSKLPTSLELA